MVATQKVKKAEVYFMKPTMTIVSRFTAILAVLALSSTMASAQLWNLTANLSGLQEVPANPSPGFGTVTLTLNDVTGVVTLTSGSYNSLLAPSAITIQSTSMQSLLPPLTPIILCS